MEKESKRNTELARELAKRCGISIIKSKKIIGELVKLITENIESGERIVLTGLCTIEVKRFKRKSTNALTGEKDFLFEYATPRAKFSNYIKYRLNNKNY